MPLRIVRRIDGMTPQRIKESATQFIKVWHLFVTVVTVACLLVGTLLAGAQLFEKRFEALEATVDVKVTQHDENIHSHSVGENKIKLDSVYVQQERMIIKLDEILKRLDKR
jgi:hypothetical protein